MKKKIILLTGIIIAVVSFIFVYRYYNHEDETTSLTISEKRWVQENKSKTIDIDVLNDYPIYGRDGKGIFYDFIDDLHDNIGLELNEIPYLKTSKLDSDGLRFRILGDNEKMTKNDLLVFEDYYIAVGKNYTRVNRVSDLSNLTFGIFETDKDTVSYFMKSAKNVNYKTYTDIEALYTALNNDEVNMIILPNIMYLDNIISNTNYYINHYFTEMSKKIVLTLPKGNNELSHIINKYFKKWKATKFVKEYDNDFFNYYITENNISSKEKADFKSKTYVYGYINNVPYEKKLHGRVAGIAGEYVNRVVRLADIDIKYKKYNNKKELEKAIKNKEIDIYFDYYGLSDKNYKATLSTFIEDYVVLAKTSDNYIINSFESLKDKNVVMLKDNSLYDYVNTNAKANIEGFDNIDAMIRSANDKLIVIDRNVYNKYQSSKFGKYTVLYIDTMMNDYKFMVKKNDKVFYDLVNYTINTNSYYNYRNSGLESLNETIFESSSFGKIYAIILALIFGPIIALFVIVELIKKSKKKKKVKITDRHKYTDMLTSLKNRNYLNAKVTEWEESDVYPKSIVMIDLNNVKYINDNYGHEEGDQLIVNAAGILVNTQLENSEIIRTDGNEFLIYLVGYSERQIATYTKKLTKELKSLPHEFGAGVGFSMIEDKIKTLDDAINEATLEMITNKEDFD